MSEELVQILKMGLVEHSQLTGAFEKSMEWLGQGNLIHLPHYTPLYLTI